MREQLLQRRKQGLIILAECVLAREDIERKLAMIRADIEAIDKALSIPEDKPNGQAEAAFAPSAPDELGRKGPSTLKVMVGLAVVVLGLGLGLYIWQLALLQIVELSAAKERNQAVERRLSRLEERLTAFEEHLYAPGVKLVPGP